MGSYTVEYLSIINSTDSFCNSIESFNNLLQSYENIKANSDTLTFEKVKFEYEVQTREIENGPQRYFHLKIASPRKNLQTFKKLLKCIRKILAQAGQKAPETLRDDIGSELSNKAYPIIHEVENMMRKLITKFMLTNIGLTWIKDTIPKEVSESVKSRATKDSKNQGILFEVDFIQLSNFLFKEYRTSDSNKLEEKLAAVHTVEELDLQELKKFVPRSNWERYFSPVVDCTSEYLQRRWEKLYELRCSVAHNRLISEQDFEAIKKTSEEVRVKLSQALEKLDEVDVAEKQKEDVAENIIINMNKLYADFIMDWNMILNTLAKIYGLTVEAREDLSIPKPLNKIAIIESLAQKGVLSSDLRNDIYQLNSFRNVVVHHPEVIVSDEQLDILLIKTNEVKLELFSKLEELNSNK